MSDTAISVENVGKRYTLSHKSDGEQYTTLRDVIARQAAAPFKAIGKRIRGRSASNGSHPHNSSSPHSKNAVENFWALKNVSFQIKQGEVVGIIGRNGAGKSTLLKILSRITEPTEGRIRIRGRVASLLEVGTGFHPELTGRENIFLNGAILGMSRVEIKAKFDEIVAFAEVDKFLDTPVKRYSSGMYVRLAFAVAAHLEPEILIVDEVLAVGDTEFQKKCLGKMEDVSHSGRTVIFVSHNMAAITTLTKTSALIQAGKCVFFGETQDAVGKYLSSMHSIDPVYVDRPSASSPKVTRVEVRTSEPNNVQRHGESMEVHIHISTPVPVRGAWLSFQIINELQQPFVHLWTSNSERSMCREPGVYQLVCCIPKARLYLGRYTLRLYLSEPPGGCHFQTIENICPFEVVMHGHYREYSWEPGTCAYIEDCKWQVMQRADPEIARLQRS
jgi:lipopolysaccharide transport system ATP-binding protein